MLELDLNRLSAQRSEESDRLWKLEKIITNVGKIVKYFEDICKNRENEILVNKKMKETLLADSLMLSATLHYLSEIPFYLRKSVRSGLKELFKSEGISVYEPTDQNENYLVRLYGSVMKEIEDIPKWRWIAHNYCVSLEFIYELFFLVSFSQESFILKDCCGIASKILSEYRIPGVQTKISQKVEETTICYGLEFKLKSLTESTNTGNEINFVINGDLDESEISNLCINVQEVLIKNLFQEKYEESLKLKLQWQDELKKENEIDVSIVKELDRLITYNDISLESLNRLAQKISEKNQVTQIFEKYLKSISEQTILFSYSKTLTLVN